MSAHMFTRFRPTTFLTTIVTLGLCTASLTPTLGQQAQHHPHSEHLQVLQPFLGQWEFAGVATAGSTILEGTAFKGTLSARWILKRCAIEGKWSLTGDNDEVLSQVLFHYSWDPLKKKIVADARSSEGEIVHEELVQSDGTTFVFQATHRLEDGTSKTSTRTTVLDPDQQGQTTTWSNQIVGGQKVPDMKVISKRVPRPLMEDRAAVIGTWTTSFTNDKGQQMRVVKEVKRNRETVHYYDASDTLTRTHTNRYWLQRRGNYNTWTFPGMKIVAGKDAGTQDQFPQVAWYIYHVDGDHLSEFQGLGEADGKPQVLKWARVKE